MRQLKNKLLTIMRKQKSHGLLVSELGLESVAFFLFHAEHVEFNNDIQKYFMICFEIFWD